VILATCPIFPPAGCACHQREHGAAIDLGERIGLLRSQAETVIAWREKTPCKLDDLKTVPDSTEDQAAKERIVCF
jgi:hypothetical protein